MALQTYNGKLLSPLTADPDCCCGECANCGDCDFNPNTTFTDFVNTSYRPAGAPLPGTPYIRHIQTGASYAADSYRSPSDECYWEFPVSEETWNTTTEVWEESQIGVMVIHKVTGTFEMTMTLTGINVDNPDFVTDACTGDLFDEYTDASPSEYDWAQSMTVNNTCEPE